MSGETSVASRQGLLNTNIIVLRRWIDPSELPDEMATTRANYAGLEKLIRIVPVTRLPLPHEKNPSR